MDSHLICSISINDLTLVNFGFIYLPLVSEVMIHGGTHMCFPVKKPAINLLMRNVTKHVTKTFNYLITHQLRIPTKRKSIIDKARWDFERLVLPFTSFRVSMRALSGERSNFHKNNIKLVPGAKQDPLGDLLISDGK